MTSGSDALITVSEEEKNKGRAELSESKRAHGLYAHQTQNNMLPAGTPKLHRNP